MNTASAATTRATRANLRKRTCYDAYLLNQLAFAELCGNCRNYLAIPYKKKAQHEMGKRDYQCKAPGKESKIIGVTAESPKPKKRIQDRVEPQFWESPIVVGHCARKKIKYKEINRELRSSVDARERDVERLDAELKCSQSKNEDLSRGFHESQCRGNSLAEALESTKFELVVTKEELAATKEELESVKEALLLLQRDLEVVNQHVKNVEQECNLLKEEVSELEQKNEELSRREKVALTSLRQCRDKYHTLQGKLRTTRQQCETLVADSPSKAAIAVIKKLQQKEVADKDIVRGFMTALTKTKKLSSEVVSFLTEQENHIARLKKYFGDIRYKEIQEMFKPWVCLRELDLVATVSFRGYEVIRRIEFHEAENCKYMRGLFKNRQTLSRLSAQLEQYAGSILPYNITDNAVIFETKPAVRWLLQKYGLWDYVSNGENVQLAATVDGGELSWQLTQISAGVKICDARAIDPRSGQLLFSESGYKQVQSRNVCFPLRIHIAKDNAAFYDQHLTSFFDDMNDLEQELGEGLVVTHGADMCSLQKTVKRGKCAGVLPFSAGLMADFHFIALLVCMYWCYMYTDRWCYETQDIWLLLLQHT